MSSTAAPLDVAPIPVDDAELRAQTRRQVFQLVQQAQTASGLDPGLVLGIIALGESRGWPDVVRLGLYLGHVNAHYIGEDPTDWLRRLYDSAQRDGDVVMTALALAVRSLSLDIEPGRASVDADRDLARAIVMLEGWSGVSTEAVSAHIQCARACERRDLWELQLYHYAAAEDCLDWEECAEERRAVLLYNHAELEVNWVTTMRERGEVDGIAERAARAREALAAAQVDAMPVPWREDLVIFGELVDAISPPSGGAAAPLEHAGAEYGGYVHLTRAFMEDGAQARVEVDLAIERIDPEESRRVHMLALARSSELEAHRLGHETAGLRWGRTLATREWERRLAALASMQSLLEVERLSAEHALLAQHAFLDDLTGLANRRALTRFTEGLQGRGVRAAAVAVVDLDRFKRINDTHGHAVGDETLSRLACILRDGVRGEQDLVVRLGGDEFLLMLPLHDPEAARRRCETIVQRIAAVPWGEISEGLCVTASLGIAFGSLEDFDRLFGDADAALYRAKQAGGDRVSL